MDGLNKNDYDEYFKSLVNLYVQEQELKILNCV